MQWAVENLHNHTLYSIGDDDVLVILAQLHSLIEENRPRFTVPTIFPIICVYGGKVNDYPARNSKSKYYISKEQYADNVWPRYCLGATTVATVSQFYAKSKTEPYLAMDDVWITGILRKKLNISDDAIVFHKKTGIAIHKFGKLIIS